MTAMCDVAFLLLTFFMLATKFKPDEPVIVKTPRSISAFPQPENSVLLTIDKTGKVFFSFDNTAAKKEMIKGMDEEKGLGLSEQAKLNFINGKTVGHPFGALETALTWDGSEGEISYPGIPNDTKSFAAENNELVFWVKSAMLWTQSIGQEVPRICIKADSQTPYPKIRAVITALTKNRINRINLLTSAQAIPPGTAAYEEAMAAAEK